MIFILFCIEKAQFLKKVILKVLQIAFEFLSQFTWCEYQPFIVKQRIISKKLFVLDAVDLYISSDHIDSFEMLRYKFVLKLYLFFFK